jgi:hypothetical protein
MWQVYSESCFQFRLLQPSLPTSLIHLSWNPEFLMSAVLLPSWSMRWVYTCHWQTSEMSINAIRLSDLLKGRITRYFEWYPRRKETSVTQVHLGSSEDKNMRTKETSSFRVYFRHFVRRICRPTGGGNIHRNPNAVLGVATSIRTSKLRSDTLGMMLIAR